MKALFNSNNRGKLTLYILFAVAILALVVLLLIQMLFHVSISLLVFLFIFMCIMFVGGFIIQIRSGPPW